MSRGSALRPHVGHGVPANFSTQLSPSRPVELTSSYYSYWLGSYEQSDCRLLELSATCHNDDPCGVGSTCRILHSLEPRFVPARIPTAIAALNNFGVAIAIPKSCSKKQNYD